MPCKNYQKRYKKWKDYEVDFLILTYPSESIKEIAKVIQKTKDAIIKKANSLNLKNKLYTRQYVTDSFFGDIVYRAKLKNIEISISPEYIEELLEKQNFKCALTAWPIEIDTTTTNGKSNRSTASVDRIDSSKGYVVGNIQLVHKYVNVAKHIMGQEEFIQMCYAVVRNN